LCSNSFQILLFFTLLTRGAAEIHANISAVERVVQLSKVETEPDVPLTHETCPSVSWPAHGEVSFHGVVMSYSRDSPSVLKGVDFSIMRGEKIGIVGRTGAWVGVRGRGKGAVGGFAGAEVCAAA
jgi:ABC-type multidrug transport system fused ATPase/permease subunit